MSANNESEQSDDYELYSPLGSREETRTGKGFLVRCDQSQCAVISPMLSVCWRSKRGSYLTPRLHDDRIF